MEELGDGLPTDKIKRKAAVCVFDEKTKCSLLADACEMSRWDMAAALVREHGHPVDLCDPRDGWSALHNMCCASLGK